MNIVDIFNNIITFLKNQELLVKASLSLVIILFSLFTVIMARQISALTDIVNQVTFSPIFKFTAYVLIGITFILLVIVIFV
jgi:hypothetical protein